jgi:hypothetical protein
LDSAALIVKQLSLLLALLGSACFAHAADTPAARPNVVILLTDDQGTLDANCYGSADLQTPHIDKLAATGIRFTQAYAHSTSLTEAGGTRAHGSATRARSLKEASGFRRSSAIPPGSRGARPAARS